MLSRVVLCVGSLLALATYAHAAQPPTTRLDFVEVRGSVGAHSAYSADGQRIVTADESRASVRDAARGNLKGRVIDHPERIARISVSSDATLIAVSGGGKVRLWTGDGELRAAHDGDAGWLSGRGDRLAVAAGAGLRVTDTATAEEVRALRFDDTVVSCAFGPRADDVLVVVDGPTQKNESLPVRTVAELVTVKTGKPRIDRFAIDRFARGRGGETVARSPDGEVIARVLAGSVALLNATIGKTVGVADLGYPWGTADSVRFDPTGPHLLVCGPDGPVYVAEARGRELKLVPVPGSKRCTAAWFRAGSEMIFGTLPDRGHAVWVRADGGYARRDLDFGELPVRLHHPAAVALSPDGAQVAATYADAGVLVLVPTASLLVETPANDDAH